MAANPETAWLEAEKIAFDKMCEYTGYKEGQNAFRGMLPPGIYNAFGFWTGGGSGRQTWNGCFGSLVVDGSMLGRWRERDDAMKFSGKILDLLNETTNLRHIRHLQWFRIADGGMPTVASNVIALANSGKDVLIWELNIGFQLVYNLSTEY